MVFARNIYYLDNFREVIESSEKIKEIRENISSGDVYIAKKALSSDYLEKIKAYLTNVARSSIPNYRKIEIGCPNFHRINYADERAHVNGCFHQFVFFPWNQDYFNLFENLKYVYYFKNLISNQTADKYLKKEPEEGCTARLAFQFYPSGYGFLNRHKDPVDYHQLSVPTITMSRKGVDFKEGGAFVEKENGDKIYTDEISEPGDVVYFNANIVHGVDMIDPGSKDEWLDFKGRWMLLVAVNKLFGNTAIKDAVDLDKK